MKKQIYFFLSGAIQIIFLFFISEYMASIWYSPGKALNIFLLLLFALLNGVVYYLTCHNDLTRKQLFCGTLFTRPSAILLIAGILFFYKLVPGEPPFYIRGENNPAIGLMLFFNGGIYLLISFVVILSIFLYHLTKIKKKD